MYLVDTNVSICGSDCERIRYCVPIIATSPHATRLGQPPAKEALGGFGFLAQRRQLHRPLEEIRHVIAEGEYRAVGLGLGRATAAFAAP